MESVEAAIERHITAGVEIVKFFRFAHLPEVLQQHSRPFAEMAVQMCDTLKPSAERTVALRKLLESKDAAVRAALS